MQYHSFYDQILSITKSLVIFLYPKISSDNFHYGTFNRTDTKTHEPISEPVSQGKKIKKGMVKQ